jgi:hypothetical protein
MLTHAIQIYSLAEIYVKILKVRLVRQFPYLKNHQGRSIQRSSS